MLVAALIQLAQGAFTKVMAKTAVMRVFCLSPALDAGTGPAGATLEFSSSTSTINGELFPVWGNYSHASYFLLDTGFDLITGVMNVDLPLWDNNYNGFLDFFESALPVNAAITMGIYDDGLTTGTATLTWNRAAGSKNGTCNISLVDDSIGPVGTFVHAFEIYEYKGTLTYTPGATNVLASFHVVQTGDLSSTLDATATFVKSVANPSDQLTLLAGTITNDSLQSLAFEGAQIFRDPPWTTNYYGTVFLIDGDLDTPQPDYQSWVISIDDLNDSDHDGIPDFSDTPNTTTPRQPKLTLRAGPGNLLLTLSGDVGYTNRIEVSSSLAIPNWQPVITIKQTNDPQTVTLPLPTAPRFWRSVISQ